MRKNFRVALVELFSDKTIRIFSGTLDAVLAAKDERKDQLRERV